MRYKLLLLLSTLFTLAATAQECILLWDEDNMPNSRGVEQSHKEENELISEVEAPCIYSFFPSNREGNGASVLIFPPGGYTKLAYNVAGISLAKWYNTIGVAAFVVLYRLPTSQDLVYPHLAPLQDAQRALKLIRANASRWGLDPTKIGVMGSSSGGHVATTLSTLTTDYSIVGDSLDTVSTRPDFTILVSPVVSMVAHAHEGSIKNLLGAEPTEQQREYFSAELQVSAQTPPAFIVHAQNDHVVPVQNSMAYFTALTEQGVEGCSLHIFPTGRHSVALRNKSSLLNKWTTLCEEWLVEQRIIN